MLIWADMSAEFCDVAEALRPHTELSPTHYLTYMCDGGMLRLPIAKKPPKNGYRKPHWAPAVLNVKHDP